MMASAAVTEATAAVAAGHLAIVASAMDSRLTLTVAMAMMTLTLQVSVSVSVSAATETPHR